MTEVMDRMNNDEIYLYCEELELAMRYIRKLVVDNFDGVSVLDDDETLQKILDECNEVL